MKFQANDIKKYAIVQGLSFRPSDRLIINFLFWKYTPGYTSFHGKGPGGSSGSYSEQSLLGNFTFEAAKHLFLRAGCYIQHFPWLKYRCSSPSWGVKRETGIKYMPTEKLVFDWLYSYRISMVDNTATNSIPVLKKTTSRSLKFVVRYSVYDNLTLGTRIDYRIVDPSSTQRVSVAGRSQLQDQVNSGFILAEILLFSGLMIMIPEFIPGRMTCCTLSAFRHCTETAAGFTLWQDGKLPIRQN